MSIAPTYAPFMQWGEPALPALSRLIHHAFASPLDGAAKWLKDDAGLDNIRCVSVAAPHKPPAACLIRIPMGQYFGGRAVPMLGIAGVAVAPESRGKGLARYMMESLIKEAHADDFPLSSLYASTQGLYRQVGYEQGGHRHLMKIAPHRIDTRDTDPPVRPLADRDIAAVHDCYSAFAARFGGMLDRGPYVWNRVRSWREKVYSGFAIDAPGGGLEGYLYLTQVRGTTSGDSEIQLSDFVFLTPRAGRRLLSFLADFATTTLSVQFAGSPLHPALSLLNTHDYTSAGHHIWMLRIVNVETALVQRGYPQHVSAAVQLNIRDPIAKSNDGAWTLSVEHGRATVRKESAVRPAATCSINALAAIYSGLYTASQAVLLGWMEGDPAAIAAIDAVFMSSTPWMPDFF